MKRLLTSLAVVLTTLTASAQGVPFLRNYVADDYLAHNRNFDLTIGESGTVYVANFEGLLYFDHVSWHTLYTPGITRVTVSFRDKNNVIWVGGYNYFGKIMQKENGSLWLKRVGGPGSFRGEIQELWKEGDTFYFLNNDGTLYQVKNDSISPVKKLSAESISLGTGDIIDVDSLKQGEVIIQKKVNRREPLANGMEAIATKEQGLRIVDKNGQEVCHLTEANGLCSNGVTWIEYDEHGQLWGATNNGVFEVAVSSAFSRFTPNEGLPGEVYAITSFRGTKYVGTNHGIFRQEGMRFVQLDPDLDHACWKLVKYEQGLLAATANGVYSIAHDGTIKQLSKITTTSLLLEGKQIYSGEIDGVYQTEIPSMKRNKVCQLENVTNIVRDDEGTIWLQSLYGEIWRKRKQDYEFLPLVTEGESDEDVATVVMMNGKATIVSTETSEPFPYPQFSFTDDKGVTWLTNHDGKNLYRWKDGKPIKDMYHLLYPFRKTAIRSMYTEGDEIWLGTDYGLTVINTSVKDPALETKPKLMIRSVILGSDSVLWGGYGPMPKALPDLKSRRGILRFNYSIDYSSPVGEPLYRYQLNDGGWSAWSKECSAVFVNLPHGNYTFNVQAIDAFGRMTNIASIDFHMDYPLYLKWYMICLYIILLGILVYLFGKWRLRQLEKEKMQLEKVVQERTAEVTKQKDEIQEKSESLEKALEELSNTQNELIRQEKLATVGKLTQGLIDRILNPLNYINNFSKLSEGLVKDIEANIADDKDKMDPENYDDTVEVLGMLKGNLQKVGEHGVNTTRTLKAMEEMLKDRTSGVIKMDLCNLLKQNEEMVETYFAKQISEQHVKVVFDYPNTPLYVNANPELLSRVIMSLISNSMYAVVKKTERAENYQPEISYTVSEDGNMVTMRLHDNGTGISDNIIGKIFDPFFTTKTTSEASGIGLYLSHDIIQNYGGDITVRSVKSEFTEFTITMPIIKE